MLCYSFICCLDVVNKQFQVLFVCIISKINIVLAITQFEFKKEVVQQVLFNLSLVNV
jgi:hypothetical protein